ncbi:MAG: hypothetical protein K0U29_02340 [Gammaproteobacteria bacterium]|nr:hypothetical protein [Gammaproteobacteria bacterium]
MARSNHQIQWALFYSLPNQVKKLIIRYILENNFKEAERLYKLNVLT